MRDCCYSLVVAATVMVAGASRVHADNLSTLVCANGGPTYVPFTQAPFQMGDIGTPMQKVELTGVDSKCNDGTPAYMYIRPASAYHNGPQLPPGALRQEKWVIFFEGGGGCRDEAECLARWCGLTGMDRASAMSSTLSYQAIPGQTGIFRRDPAVNSFAGYNHVYLNYCSSDNWIGSGQQQLADSGKLYDISFNGEAIVNDAFTRLLDPAGVGPDLARFWPDGLPSLRTADEIVLVGSSAGSVGLRHHLDRLRERLVRQVYGRAQIVGVLDAGTAPALWTPAISWGAVAGAPLSYADNLVSVVEPTVRTFWGVDDSALDASCLDPAFAAAHVADGAAHPQVCFDTTYTLFNHITTPVFMRQDIFDPVASDRYVAWQLFPGQAAYMQAQNIQSNALVGFAGRLEPIPVAPGVFTPHCNQHVNIHTNAFFGQAVRLPGNVMGTTFHDLLVNWMTGGAPSTQIQADGLVGPAYTFSFCP
jgi:pectinacetylesterase